MFKTALAYGTISGVVIIGVIMSGLLLSGGAHGHGGDGGIFNSVWFGYLVMILSLSTIFIAIRDYRNKKLGGVIKFLPALGLGLLIAFIAGVAYVVVWEVYLFSTHYTFMDHYVATMADQARASGLTGAALDAKLAEFEQMRVAYQNPIFRLGMTFMEIFPVGLLIALISAAILRNPRALPARA